MFFILTAICLSVAAFAQQRDTIVLGEVPILSNRLENFSSGNKIVKLDSNSLQQFSHNNLATLLSQNNSLFIKSYGQGSLATSSIRGAGAAHTAVLWNGFNINSPILGQLDLSLLPVNFIDNAAIQYGGSGTLWGSGTVGGAIHLNNNQQFDKGISVNVAASYGSYSSLQQNVSIGISKKRWINSTRLFYRDAKNDFTYYNTSLDIPVKQKQSNAQLNQYGLLQENYFLINSHQKINIRFWYQNNNRNIPPNMLQAESKAQQQDYFYRSSAEWQRTGNKVTWFARTAYFNDYLIYQDKSTALYSPSHSANWISEAESKIVFNPLHSMNVGVNNTYASAYTDAYSITRFQNRTSLFSSYRFTSKNKRWDMVASARQEFVKQKNIPLTYSAGFEGKIWKYFTLKGNANKIYRLPTLNDLFWTPGGNPNLLPEEGYSEDAGLSTEFKFEKIELKNNVTVFNRNVNNWIIWLPSSGGIWSPQNIAKVWSRGMETQWEVKLILKNIICKVGVNTNYVLSTNEKSKTEDDASLGRQLIYVPMYSGSGNITLQYKSFYFNYNHTYTGYRYTSTDNYEYLKPYTLGNIQCSYSFTIKNHLIKFFGQLNNVWKTQYQVLSQQAMPLTNYQAGFSLNYYKPNQ